MAHDYPAGNCSECDRRLYHEANPNWDHYLIKWKKKICCGKPNDICTLEKDPKVPPGALLDMTGTPSSLFDSTHNSYPGTSYGGCKRECLIYVDLCDPIVALVNQLTGCGMKTPNIVFVCETKGSLTNLKSKKNFRRIIGAAENQGITFSYVLYGGTTWNPLVFP